VSDATTHALSKVPAVTLGFWVIKVLATALGETGGDTVTMTLNWAVSHGGLDLSRPLASAVIGVIIIAGLIVLPQRPGQHPGEAEGSTATA